MAQHSPSSTFLAIPAASSSTKMTRSSSHESFATDASLLSLSSFASEIPVRQHSKNNADKDDDPDSEKIDYVLAKYREDILEKMLETNACSVMKNLSLNDNESLERKRSKSQTVKKSEKFPSLEVNSEECEKDDSTTAALTASDEELLKECSRCKEPRMKGSLYKSFSTSDVVSLNDTFRHLCTVSRVDEAENYRTANREMKSCASQAFIPNDYARVAQRRKKHMRDLLHNMSTSTPGNDDEWRRLLKEDMYETPTEGEDSGAGTPDAPGPPKALAKRTMLQGGRKKLFGRTASEVGADQYRKTTSEENVIEKRRDASKGRTFLKKLKISKEIGNRIRDDLMNRLSKQKQNQETVVTNLDLEREKGRPLTKLERNFMIFHWLQSLDDDSFLDA